MWKGTVGLSAASSPMSHRGAFQHLGQHQPPPPNIHPPGGILAFWTVSWVSLSKSAWSPGRLSARVMLLLTRNKKKGGTAVGGAADMPHFSEWNYSMHIPPPTRLPSLLPFDWSSPAVADVRRVLMWTCPRARASILPPIDARKTPEERRCRRCQGRVRCSSDADSRGG